MPDKIDDAIFDFAYVMAMRDATQQQAFPAMNKKLLWEKGEEAAEVANARQTVKCLLKGYIDDILDENKEPQEFYGLAKDVEDAVLDLINKAGITNNEWTFGNTQKLINMTAKYMFTATYNNPKLREAFEKCHCPMDSQTMAEAKRGLHNPDQYGIEHTKCMRQLKQGKNKGQWVWKDLSGETEKELSWSGLKWKSAELRGTEEGAPDAYRLFQASISELAEQKGLSPLEFDFYAWGQ